MARFTHDTAISRTAAAISQPIEGNDTSDDAAERLGVLLGASGPNFKDLAAVVKAWPTLAEAIRRAVAAMIEASR